MGLKDALESKHGEPEEGGQHSGTDKPGSPGQSVVYEFDEAMDKLAAHVGYYIRSCCPLVPGLEKMAAYNFLFTPEINSYGRACIKIHIPDQLPRSHIIHAITKSAGDEYIAQTDLLSGLPEQVPANDIDALVRTLFGFVYSTREIGSKEFRADFDVYKILMTADTANRPFLAACIDTAIKGGKNFSEVRNTSSTWGRDVLSAMNSYTLPLNYVVEVAKSGGIRDIKSPLEAFAAAVEKYRSAWGEK